MTQPSDPVVPFEAFRQIVLADPALLDQLRAAPDLEAFVALVRETAAQRGIQLSTEDVQAALRASQQAWIERWI